MNLDVFEKVTSLQKQYLQEEKELYMKNRDMIQQLEELWQSFELYHFAVAAAAA